MPIETVIKDDSTGRTAKVNSENELLVSSNEEKTQEIIDLLTAIDTVLDAILVDTSAILADTTAILADTTAILAELQAFDQTRANRDGVAITAATDILSSDLSPTGTSAGDVVVFHLEFSADINGKLTYTLDGTNFVDINKNATIKANNMFIFDILVHHADLFNIQFSATGNTVFCRVTQRKRA